VPYRPSRLCVADSSDDAGFGERSRNSAEPSRIDARLSWADPLGNVVGRHGADFEQPSEQRSTGSSNVNVSQSFEPEVSRILAAFAFLFSRA
jgi:hypothetical protein